MITVTPDLVTFSLADGDRRTIRLQDLFASFGASKDECDAEARAVQRQGLLLWGCFYQLVEISQVARQINERLGHVNMEKAEGSGLTGLNAQQTTSLIECSKHLGTLVELFQTIEQRSQEGGKMNIAAVMAEASKHVAEVMGAAGSPPVHPPTSNDGS